MSAVNAREIQTRQFEKISKNYDEVHDRVVFAIYRILQEKYYPRCRGKRVLDIGNGGQPPEKLMGPDIGSTLADFVGMDNSLAMLQRTKHSFDKVVADALRLPFKDSAFDYVVVSGLLHHLGYESAESNARRIKQFLQEAIRVSSREVIIHEIVTHPLLERMEKIAAGFLKVMPTFVLSDQTLDRYVRELGLERKEIHYRRLSQLTRPLYWYIIVMDYEWLKLPAFCSPFDHEFFVISRSGARSPLDRSQRDGRR